MKRDIDRTRNGLAILALAALLAIVPLCGGVFHFLLGLIGAILVLTARHSFDPIHRSNVFRSVVIWIVGFFVALIGGVIAVLVLLSGVGSGPEAIRSAVSSMVDAILITTVASTFLLGFAWVLLPYRLATTEGRIFLWSGFGVELAASFALAFFFRNLFVSAMVEGLASGDPGALDFFEASYGGFIFFEIAAAGLYALAYVQAAGMLSRGATPVEPTTSAM